MKKKSDIEKGDDFPVVLRDSRELGYFYSSEYNKAVYVDGFVGVYKSDSDSIFFIMMITNKQYCNINKRYIEEFDGYTIRRLSYKGRNGDYCVSDIYHSWKTGDTYSKSVEGIISNALKNGAVLTEVSPDEYDVRRNKCITGYVNGVDRRVQYNKSINVYLGGVNRPHYIDYKKDCTHCGFANQCIEMREND